MHFTNCIFAESIGGKKIKGLPFFAFFLGLVKAHLIHNDEMIFKKKKKDYHEKQL